MMQQTEYRKETPQLLFTKWHWVEAEGLPEEEYTWCMIMWKCFDGSLDVFAGSYSKERQAFYADYGFGGAVLDGKRVLGWAAFEECRWHVPKLEQKLKDEFQETYRFHIYISLDEERMAQNGLKPEKIWTELSLLMADTDDIGMVVKGHIVAVNADCIDRLNEQLKELSWFMEYVTRWESDVLPVKDDMARL